MKTKKTTEKPLTFAEFQKLALEHYNEGGDTYVECWDEQTFNESVKQFGPITKSKALQKFGIMNSITREYEAAAEYFSGESNNNTEKENDTMTTINPTNNNISFELNGITYTSHIETGRYSKTENGKTKRIGAVEFRKAEQEHDEQEAKKQTDMELIKAYWMATMAITETREQMDEAWATEIGMADLMDWFEAEKEAGITEEEMQEAILAAAVQEAEEKKNTEAGKEIAKKLAPKTRKPRKSKDVAYETNFENAHLTLTAKQVDFIKHLPDTMFWEQGLDSSIWVDCLCDDIKGQFAGKPMTVGAMISTLCEKGLGIRATERRDGRKCTSFELTELGKIVAAELGLH